MLYLGRLREGRTSVVLFTEGWRLFNDDGGLTGYQGTFACYAVRPIPGPVRQSGSAIEIPRDSEPGEPRERDVLSGQSFGARRVRPPISSRQMGTGNITQSPVAQGLNNLRDRSSNMQTLASNTDGIAVVNTNDLKDGTAKSH